MLMAAAKAKSWLICSYRAHRRQWKEELHFTRRPGCESGAVTGWAVCKSTFQQNVNSLPVT